MKHIVAEPLPELCRAVGREVRVEALSSPAKAAKGRRRVPVGKEEELWPNFAPYPREHSVPFDKTTFYARPNTRWEIDVFTAPLEVGPLCRLSRIVVPPSIAGDLVIRELCVEGRPNMFSLDVPALLFGAGGPSLLPEVHVQVGQRVRMRVRNTARRQLVFRAVAVFEEVAVTYLEEPLPWAPPFWGWGVPQILPPGPIGAGFVRFPVE